MSAEDLSEKYRPKSLDDVIGQDSIIRRIKTKLKKGFHSDCLFIGPKGVGKTTVAQCIAREFYERYWDKTTFGSMRRAPVEGEYDDVLPKCFRLYHGSKLTKAAIDKMKIFAIQRGRKIIFIDEADQISKSDQTLLRPLLEGKRNSTYILACNDGSKIDLKSRLVSYRFKPITEENIFNRLRDICVEEELIEPGAPSVVYQFLRKLSREAGGDLRNPIKTLEDFITPDGFEIKSIELHLEGK